MATAMRDEGGGRKVPQQSIQRVGERRALCAEHYTYTVLQGSVAQLAGGAQFVGGTGIKIDFRHFNAARLMRYCVSSGTGRPVAPFSLPDFHAVPAISRCAQR